MIAKIEQLLKEVEALHASNAEELEALRIKYLSKNFLHYFFAFITDFKCHCFISQGKATSF